MKAMTTEIRLNVTDAERAGLVFDKAMARRIEDLERILRKHHDALREYASEIMASSFDVIRVAKVAGRLDELCNAVTADIAANTQAHGRPTAGEGVP